MAGRESRLVVGRTELHVPNSAGEIAYVFPAINGSYRDVGKQIIEEGLVVPTGDLTAPFVRDLYLGINKNEKPVANARGLVGSRWLWVYNQNLHDFEGLFSVKDRNADGLSNKLNVNELKQRLVGGSKHKDIEFSSDGEVAFAPRGSYTFGEMEDAGKLALDGAVIVQYGVEGAKLLAEASATLKNVPKTYGVDVRKGQEPVQRISTLVEQGGRLHVDGDWGGNVGDGKGYAFPVSAPPVF